MASCATAHVELLHYILDCEFLPNTCAVYFAPSYGNPKGLGLVDLTGEPNANFFSQ